MKVVVCGSNFGRHYLRACLDEPSFAAVGLLSRGSVRSKQLADAYGVQSFTSVETLPSSVRFACLAVPEKEAEPLITKLLRRGINLLTEHPVSAGLVDRASRLAESSGVKFHVNFHIADYSVVQRFITEVRRERGREAPLFISAFTSPRCVHQVMDIIGRALGGLRPVVGFRAGPTASVSPELSLRSASGGLAGVPTSIQMTSFMAAADDLSDAFLNHQITVGFRHGNWVLVDTLGPVVWCARGLNRVAASEPRVQRDVPAEGLSHDSLDELLRPARTEAIQRALQRLQEHAAGGACPEAQRQEYVRDVCEHSRNLEILLHGLVPHASSAGHAVQPPANRTAASRP